MKRVPWVLLLTVTLTVLIWAGLTLQAAGLPPLPPCPLKRLFGLPCLSCGLTRCFSALVRGDVRQAFHWHPVGTMVALILPLVAAWDGLRALRGQAYPSLPENPVVRWAVFGALAGTWWLQVARGI